MLRVVLDTNILISGLLCRNGASAQALSAWRERRYLLVTSPAIIAEFQAVLSYSRIRAKYTILDDDIRQIAALLNQDALLVPGDIDVAGAIPADPDDEKFLACALESQADLIVSGDHHLLELENYKEIPIVTVRRFLDLIPTGKPFYASCVYSNSFDDPSAAVARPPA
jgi:putative PIN family toxin of toxin-antitoxin system